MGKSNSIQEQLKNNQAFTDYVQKISADMENRQNKMASQLENMEKEHYASFDDKALLMEGRYSHLTTTSEWSLKSISKIIDSCSKAIFGSKEPEGTTKPEESQKVSASLQAIKEREVYISNQAFDVVQSIVSSFTNSTSTSVEQKLDGKPIAPGMTMFIGVENNAFAADSFFRNEKIIQTIFVFKVCYSIKEGMAQSALSDLQAYEDQKTSYRNKMQQLNQMLDALDVTSDDYEEQEQKYADRLEVMNNRLEKLNEKIKALQANAIQKDQAFCEDMRKKLMNRRQNRLMANRRIASSWFTYTGSSETIYDSVLAYCPGDLKMKKVERDDYVGTHYRIHFTTSNRNYGQYDVDQYIKLALSAQAGNFYFDPVD